MTATAIATERIEGVATTLDQAIGEYQRSPRPQAWRWVLESGLPLIHYHAQRLTSRLPATVEEEDLIQEGVFGLADALESYDPDRGVRFATFAAPRIRGAMLDYLRSIDWVPRLVRQRIRQWENAYEKLARETGEPPDDQALRQELGLSADEYERVRRDVELVRLVSLEQDAGRQSDRRQEPLSDILADRRRPDPRRTLSPEDFEALLAQAPSRASRLILTLYYREEMTMAQVGETLGISESRISQILTTLRLDMQPALA